MQVDYSENQATDQKQRAILGAAMEAFAHYGFRRVSMEDIARRSGMSRAALYLYFRNKEDIYRTMIEGYFGYASGAIRAALEEGETPTESLRNAFRAKVAPPFDRLLESPHGPELLDAKSDVAADVVADGDALLRQVFADWLQDAEAEGALSLRGAQAPDLADTILSSVHGVANEAKSYGALLASLDRLADILGAGLRAG